MRSAAVVGPRSEPVASVTTEWTGALVNGGLTIEVERVLPAVTLRPHGVLDAYTAPDLRAALQDGFAEQAGGVILDVSALTVGDEVGLAVLANAAQENRRWPGVGLVLVGPSPQFRAAADRIGIPVDVQVRATVAEAQELLAAEPAPPRVRAQIAPDRNGPGVARGLVQDFCAAHGVTGNAEAAQLVASELVTNAVVHAGTPIELTLRLVGTTLHIAVRDTGDGHARITGTVDESAESGRGLVLVDALASSWGTFVPSSGKIVWATLRVRLHS